MKRILKYQLKITDEQKIHSFRGFKPLSVHEQNGVLCLWMMTDDRAKPCIVNVHIAGTGNEFDDYSLEYVGTALMNNGLVWHVYIDPVSSDVTN
jgi:hypothetical protein